MEHSAKKTEVIEIVTLSLHWIEDDFVDFSSFVASVFVDCRHRRSLISTVRTFRSTWRSTERRPPWCSQTIHRRTGKISARDSSSCFDLAELKTGFDQFRRKFGRMEWICRRAKIWGRHLEMCSAVRIEWKLTFWAYCIFNFILVTFKAQNPTFVETLVFKFSILFGSCPTFILFGTFLP